MDARHLIKIVCAGLALGLTGCATAPRNINNVCAVFEQQDGWIDNWQRAANKASKRHGIPVPVLMATIRKESGFDGKARPPRTWYLGFIPGKRASSAYGYAQALDGTWAEYRREAGGFGSSRDDFEDAVDFVGWYHAKTVSKFGVDPRDAYNLYLAFYSGWAAYGNGSWRSHTGLQKTARASAEMAQTYSTQMQRCR
jgi:hypothetical protein